MIPQLAARMLGSIDPRVMTKLMVNGCWKGFLAVNRFKRHAENHSFFPPFLFISITNQCNLRCQGCWISSAHHANQMSADTLNRVIAESKKNGVYFFGILGGEPLLHTDLFQVMERHSDCYFQVFSNGTLITPEVAAAMRRLGNITPVVSIEGNEAVSDERRGGTHVYERSMQGLENCRRNKLFTGVATSICKSNFADHVSKAFIHDLMDRGVHYLWYYIYRPVGGDPSRHLALSNEEIVQLRRFIVESRRTTPMMIVDTYWDHMGRALCPAAKGISHHINPRGDIEICPPIQFAKDNIGDGSNLAERFRQSAFLQEARSFLRETTDGCILLDQPMRLRDFLVTHAAEDTGGRGHGMDELAMMTPLPSHHQPGSEIPESHWFYRLAKKYWFFGMGAYG